jgi:hypothetical protein
VSEWHFRRRHGQCSLCRKPFEVGASHMSALSLVERALSREDLCLACWPSGRERALFWWRAKHTLEKARRPTLNVEAVEGLFQHLAKSAENIEGAEPELLELRYLLALLLVRKRKLRIVRFDKQGAREFVEVRRPRAKTSERVWVMDFSPERLTELGARLNTFFEEP